MCRITPALAVNLTFINDLADWDRIARPWNELLARSAVDVPFLRHEFQRAWWSTLGGGEWPDGELWVAIGREDDGELAGAASFFRTSSRPRTLLLVGTSEIADYLDFVTPASKVEGFAGALMEAVQQGPPETDTIDLWNVLETSPAAEAISTAAARAGWSVERTRLKPCPQIDLAGGWESYLDRLDKKQRHELRRKLHRVENTAGASFLRAGHGPELTQAVEDFLDLMRFDEGKSRFLTPSMHALFQELARSAAQSGWLRLELLRIDGRPAAGAFCFDYGNRLLVYNSGLDPAYQALSPGWALLGNLIRSAAAEGKEAVDFMRGDEDYKFRLGGRARYVERLILRRKPD